MPKFSELSKSRLATCHPELQILFNEVIKTFDCTILEGFRNEADQQKAFRDGNSKLQWPNGNHNKYPSLAVDVSPYPVQWDKINRFYWFAGHVLGVATILKQAGTMTRLVRYGGDWNRNKVINDETFLDLVHFELLH